jgi:hypothetical protein
MTDLISHLSMLFARILGLCGLAMREVLVKEVRQKRYVYQREFPVLVPLLIEKAHRDLYPTSSVRSTFHLVYLATVIGIAISAGFHLVSIFQKHF